MISYIYCTYAILVFNGKLHTRNTSLPAATMAVAHVRCVNQKFSDQFVCPHSVYILHLAIVFLFMIRGGKERGFHSRHR